GRPPCRPFSAEFCGIAVLETHYRRVRANRMDLFCLFSLAVGLLAAPAAKTPAVSTRPEFQPALVPSTWADILEGVDTPAQWRERKQWIRQQFLELLRDEHKPEKPPLEMAVHERVDVEGIYTRRLVSYNVESDERAHAYLAIPHGLTGKAPAMVV